MTGLTATAARILAAAALGAAAGVLAATLTRRLRWYTITSLPGTVAVRLRCGRDTHQDCPPDCPPDWVRGFAVYGDEDLELWHYYSMLLRPSHRVPYASIPYAEGRHHTLESDQGPVQIELPTSVSALIVPGPTPAPKPHTSPSHSRNSG